MEAFDGVDWFWLPSIFGARWLLIRHRPQVADLRLVDGHRPAQLHSAGAPGQAAAARRSSSSSTRSSRPARPASRSRAAISTPSRRCMMRLADGFAVHSEFDRTLAVEHWRLGRQRPIEVLPHGPHDHYQGQSSGSRPGGRDTARRLREPPEDVCNLLFFGVIRPYKGTRAPGDRLRGNPRVGGRSLLVDGRRRDVGGLDAAERADRAQPTARPDLIRQPLRDGR